MAKVVLIVAQEGYQGREYTDSRRALENAGHVVSVAAMELREASSNMGDHIMPDIAVGDIEIDDIDAMYTIGGPGALHSLDNETVRNLFVRFKNETHKPYGGICISPRILAKAGVLEGVHATGWNNDRELGDILKGGGAIYVQQPVVEDGRVTTADGPASARIWGEAIANRLSA